MEKYQKNIGNEGCIRTERAQVRAALPLPDENTPRIGFSVRRPAVLKAPIGSWAFAFEGPWRAALRSAW